MVWIILLALVLALIPQPASAGTQPTFRMNIFPLECSLDLVQNGSSNSTQITPENCEGILFPEPPVPEVPRDEAQQLAHPVGLPRFFGPMGQTQQLPDGLGAPPLIETLPSDQKLDHAHYSEGSITGSVQMSVLAPFVIILFLLICWTIWRLLHLLLLALRRRRQ